jgi:hypothetical protein
LKQRPSLAYHELILFIAHTGLLFDAATEELLLCEIHTE